MQNVDIQYSVFDPTGNITALVESDIESGLQPSVAAGLMERRPEVEQVGFVRLAPYGEGPSLRMAGGEFCGNAAMSAAALYLIRRLGRHGAALPPGAEETVRLRVSGAAQPVEVRLRAETQDCFRAGVHMPPALDIDDREFTCGALSGKLPVVWMEGICHIVVEPDSVFWALLADRAAAGCAVRDWCAALSADGLGLMFLDGGAPRRLTPLVYVPGSGTVFWEGSCASGSTAAGMYLAAKTGAGVDLSLQEPGGVLRVASDPVRGETWLYGRVKLVEQCRMFVE